MKKSIWKVIGIVLGSITGLFGVTIGVLAIQGKFSTPVLYPEILSFDDNHKIILPVLTDAERESHDEEWRDLYSESIKSYYDDNRDLYYFVLTGTNSNEEYPVNRKTCYIWFDDNVGNDLITLCDGRGNPLEIGTNNRYMVECNEKIYFELKEGFADTHYVESNENQGLINIRACTEDRKVYVDEDLSIWIDRRVDSIFVDHDASTKSENSQEIEIGLDQSITVDYKVGPTYSLDPISVEDGKVVELYYVGSSETNYRPDYVLVNKDSVEGANKDGELSNLFYYEGDQLMFRANSSEIALGKYYFKIAVFPTYKDRDDFDAKHQEPISNKNRLAEMLFTDLTIKVIPTDVDRVSIRDGELVLNLFKNSNISLNSSAEGMTNLNIQMYVNGGNTTSIRYSEVEINKLHEYGSEKEVMFMPVGSINPADQISLSAIDASVEKELSNITIPLGTIVESITINGVQYKCSNGVAVLTTDNRLKLLEAGSYLDVYEKDIEGSVSYSSINLEDYFEISDKVESDRNDFAKNYWTIRPKKTLDKRLSLGILVVNSTGTVDINKFFATTDIQVQEQAMTYDVNIDNAIDLAIKYGEEVAYDEIAFDDIINIKSGSYDKCVLLIKKIAEKDINTYPVHVLDFGHRDYLLVGYIDENDKFVNAIKSRSASKDKIEFYIGQIAHEFSDINKGVAYFVEKYIEDSEHDFIVKNISRISGYTPIVRPMLEEGVLLGQLFNISYEINGEDRDVAPTSVHAGSADHKVILSELESHSGLLASFASFYGESFANHFSTKNNVGADITNLFRVTNVERDDNVLTITFGAFAETTGARIVWTEGDISIDVISNLTIASSTPTSLVYRDEDGEEITLAKDINDPRPKITIEINYDGGLGYTYSYKYDGADIEPLTLNDVISADDSAIGFHDPIYKNVEYDVSYTFDNNYVSKTASELNINSIGSTLMSVTVGGATFYIDIDVIANVNTADPDAARFNLSLKNGNNIKEPRNGFTLNTVNGSDNDIITYNYINASTTNIVADVDNHVNIENLNVISFGSNGANVAVPRVDNQFVFKNDTATVLTIQDTDNGWTFTRANDYLYTPITIKFDISTPVGTLKDVQIEFISSIELDNVNKKNWDIENGAVNIYEDTSVKLVEVQADENDFASSAIIKVLKKGTETIIANLYKDGEKTQITSDDDFVLDTSSLEGDYKVKISVDGQELSREYNIRVIPNVVINEVESLVKTNIKTNNLLSNIFEAKAYETLISGAAYGSSEEKEGKVYKVSDATKTSSAVLSYEWSNEDLDFSSASDSIPDSSNLNLNTTGDLTIKVGDRVVGVITGLTITHDKEVEQQTDIKISSKEVFDNNTILSSYGGLTLNSISVVNADGTPVSGITIEGTSDAWTLGFINQEYTDYCLKLSFDGGYVYITDKVILCPFVPSRQAVDTYSLSEFDLRDVFTATASSIKDNVSKIEVVSIDYAGIDLVGRLVDNVIYADEQYVSSKITWPEFSENEKIAVVSYKITYTDGNTSYVYDHEIKVKNRIEIKTVYPASDLQASDVLMKFFTEEEAEAYAREYGLTNLGSNVRTRSITFEAIPIHKTGEVVVDLLSEHVLGIKRMNIDNHNYQPGDESPVVSFVGYESLGGFDYYNQVSVENNRIHLKSAPVDTQGYLVFKVTTASGNYDYYIIYVNSISKSSQYIENEVSVSLTPTATSTTLVSELDGKVSNWYERFGFTSADKSKILLYSLNECEYYEKLDSRPLDWATNYKAYYKLDGINYVAIDDSSYVGDIYTRLSQYQTINKALISEVSDFTTLKLAVVYKGSGRNIYCAGVLTVYLKPDVDITATGVVADNADNGIYKADIKYNNTTGYSTPFTVEGDEGAIGLSSVTIESVKAEGITLSSDSLEYNGTKIVYITDNIIMTPKYIDQDIQFTVKYSYNNGTNLRVNYTYKAIALETGTIDIVISGYVGTDFVDSVELKDLINLDETDDGNPDNYFYTGAISDDSDKFAVVDGEITIDRDNSKQEFLAILTYDDLVSFTGYNTVNVNFTVMPKAEQSRNTETDNVGTDTNPINAVIQDYREEIGSKIELNVMSSGSNKKFTIGGYDWYVDASYNVEITFSNAHYLVDATYNPTTKKYEKTETIDLLGAATQYINFVHLAESKSLEMYVSIKSGGTLVSTNTLHITLPQTYAGLVAKYCVEGATYENVVKDSTQNNLFNYMLNANAIADGRERIGLKDLDGDIQYPDFSAMGFNTDTNPNYITFRVGDLTAIKDANGEIVGVTFTKPVGVEGDDTSIYISNQAGVGNIKYEFQLMEGVAEGIDFNGAGTAGINGDRRYVSFLTTTKEDIAGTVFGLNKLGTLRDTKNKSLFELVYKSVEIFDVNYTLTSTWSDKQIDEDGKITYELNIELTNRADATDVKYYNLYIVFDKGEIFVNGDGETEFPLDRLKLTLKMQGASGIIKNDATYEDEMDIMIFNYAISGKYESGSVDTQIAGSQVVISNIINGFNTLPNTGITFAIQDTKYTLPDEQERSIDDLITFTNNTIIFNAIGFERLPSVPIKIDVLLDGYLIDTIVYNVNITRNLQFIVNTVPTKLSDVTSIDDSTYVMSTNLLLTSDTDTGVFKTITIGADAGGTYTAENNGNKYYDDLLVYLYQRKSFNSVGLSGVTVNIKSFYSNEGYTKDECLSLVGKTLTIKKDFSGSIGLELSISTDVGVYTKRWTINVSSMVAFDNNCIDSSYISNGGDPFSSNQEVALLSVANGTDVGVKMSKWGYYESGMGQTIPDFDAYYDYMIVDYQDAIGMSSISAYYEDSKNEDKIKTGAYIHGDNTATNTSYSSNVAKVTLPVVSSATNYSLVIYKLTITYLGDTKIYYVAYKVANTQKITANTSIVNVDEDQYMKTIEDKKNYLQLFYFAETFKADEKDWTLNYKLDESTDTKKLCLSYEMNNYWWNGSVYTNGEDSYTIDGQSNLIKIGSPSDTDPISDWNIVSTTANNVYSYGIDDNNADITKFKTFIDGIDKVVLVKGGTEYKFNLMADESGMWYIDLSNWNGKVADTYLFTSEQEFRLELRSGDDKVIYSNDLTLTSDNKIDPKNSIRLENIFTYMDTTNSALLEYSIIGVSSTDDFDTDWISTSGVTYEGCSTIGTFKVDNVEYYLYSLTYKLSGGSSDIYDSESTFYAIVTNDGKDTISVVNYSSILAGNITHVYVPYSESYKNADGTTLELKSEDLIKVVYMDTVDDDHDGVTNEILTKTINNNDNPITIDISTLTADTSGKGYVEKTYVITLSGDSITEVVEGDAVANKNQRLIVVRWEKPKS